MLLCNCNKLKKREVFDRGVSSAVMSNLAKAVAITAAVPITTGDTFSVGDWEYGHVSVSFEE